MHLVHVITKCDYGGAQTVVRELALEQASRGHEVSVITGVVGPVSDELRAAGVHVEHEPALAHAIHLRHDWKALRHLTERVERLGPDLAHTHSSKAGFLGRRVVKLSLT